MQQARSYVLGLVLAVLPLTTQAQVPTGLEQRGEAEFRVFGLKLYDARLYTKDGAAFDWSRDFALEITYARRFSQDALVKSTMDEIKRIGRQSPDAMAWNGCFRSVNKGHRYLAITKGEDQVDFILNGAKMCSLNHRSVARSFMEIFLGDNTRSAKFTQALRGG